MKKIFYLLTITFFLFNCSNSDDSDNSNNPNNPSGGTMSARIDGENFFLTNTFSSLSGGVLFTTGSYGFIINAFETIDNTNLRSIGLSFGGVNFDDLSAGDEFVNDVLENSLCTFAITENSVTITGTSDGVSSWIKITSIDKVNRLISGEFNYEAIDLDDPNIIYVIDNGIFTNVPYSFIE